MVSEREPMDRRYHRANPAEIHADIERTRGRIDATLEELSARLQPRRLFDETIGAFTGRARAKGAEAAEASTDALRRTGRTLVDRAKHHPFWIALIGAGMAWWACEEDERRAFRARPGSGPRDPTYGGSYVDARTGEPYDESYGEEWRDRTGGRTGRGTGLFERLRKRVGRLGGRVAGSMRSGAESARAGWSAATGRLREWTHEAAERSRSAGRQASAAGERLGESAASAGGRARDLADQARERAYHGYERSRAVIRKSVRDHPLAVAAGVLGLGLLAGLSIPATRREDRLMGEASDEAKQRARRAGEELTMRGWEAASAGAAAAAEQAESQRLTPDQIAERGGRLVDELRDAADREGLSASALGERAREVGREAARTAGQEARRQKDEAKGERG